MLHYPHPLRRTAACAALLLLIAPLAPSASRAAEGTTLLLRPHCDKPDQEDCESFETVDPATFRTAELQPGTVLDMDVVVINPSQQPIRRVRSWLSYDPSILDGLTVSGGPDFTAALPGESSFATAEGYAKIGFSAEENAEPDDKIIPVARVRFRVRQDAGGQSPIGFYDRKNDSTGHTYVLAAGDSDTSELPESLSSLIVQVDAEPSSAALSSSSTSRSSQQGGNAQSSSAKSVAAAIPTSAFPLLQVRNVRVTTQGTSLYVSWDTLRSSQVTGYNLYYGTQMGRYIQRRSLPASATTAAIDSLPAGSTYYVAVRAVNASNQESAFSQEAAVQIGDPRTSTAPLAAIPTQTNPTPTSAAPENPITGRNPAPNVPGESGMPTGMMPLLLTSAVIGTVLAFRRQAIALPVNNDKQ